uniref:hypothetical protein n=1 Tax=Streptomyces exfoliatus TaxID=1905 RepID=UPI001B80A60B
RILGAAMRVTARESVHPWQVGLAACAVVTPLTPVIASGDPFFVLPLVVRVGARGPPGSWPGLVSCWQRR